MPAAAPATPAAVEGARAAAGSEDPQVWSTVADALRLYFWLFIAAISTAVLLGIIEAALEANRSRTGAAVVAMVSELVGLGLGIPSVVALFRYRRVPAATHGKGAATASAYLEAVVLGLSVVGLVIASLMAAGGRGAVKDLIPIRVTVLFVSGVLGIASIYTQLSSYAAVARYLKRSGIERLARISMIIYGITFGLALFAGALAAAGVGAGAGLLGLGALGIGIWAVVYHLMVIYKTSNASRMVAGT